jgi:putative flippase GtrA
MAATGKHSETTRIFAPLPQIATAKNSLRTLLTPEAGLLGEGVRYALAGSFVLLVYLLATSFLAVVLGMPFEEALIIGFTVQLAVHFTLQRLFVWVHDEAFALTLRRQARRYLVVAGAQLGATSASTALLPDTLGLPTEVVYLITVGLLAIANFLLYRNVIFHPGSEERASAQALTCEIGDDGDAARSETFVPI